MKTPILSCSNNDIYNLKVGAITADEVSFAGGVYGIENGTYYLYNNQYYWTLSPCYWYYNSSSQYWAGGFSVYNNGQITGPDVNTNLFNIRPAINLRSDIQIKANTNGTINNPYVVL